MLLALVAELAGRALVASIDVGRHVRSPSGAASYYPFLLVFVKLAVALLLARLAWRVARARALATAAERVLGTRCPLLARRPRISLSPRLWASFFCVTSLIYLIQMDAENVAAGRWPLLAPWLHSSALPVFAVLAVVLALVWHLVQQWLADYERYAEAAAHRAARAVAPRATPPTYPLADSAPPRRRFGVVVECRPPPVAA